MAERERDREREGGGGGGGGGNVSLGGGELAHLADGVLHEQQSVLDRVTQVLYQTFSILCLLCGDGRKERERDERKRERGGKK